MAHFINILFIQFAIYKGNPNLTNSERKKIDYFEIDYFAHTHARTQRQKVSFVLQKLVFRQYVHLNDLCILHQLQEGGAYN